MLLHWSATRSHLHACLAQICIACKILAHPFQSMESLRMAGCNTDGPKQAEAHGARWHCMVTRGPTDPKSSRRRAIGAAAGNHSIYQFHSCARSLQLQRLLKFCKFCPVCFLSKNMMCMRHAQEEVEGRSDMLTAVVWLCSLHSGATVALTLLTACMLSSLTTRKCSICCEHSRGVLMAVPPGHCQRRCQ